MGPLLYHRGVPLHLQIQRIMRMKLQSGEWALGDPVPTEVALMRRFHVSRATIRRALAVLVGDGLIARRPRLGSIVIGDGTRSAAAPVITNAVMGYEAEIRVISGDDHRPPRHVASFLGMSPDEPVCRFVRLESVGGAPLCVVVNYLPAAIGRRVPQLEMQHRSMLYLLTRRLGIPLGTLEQSLEAKLPDEQVAGLLQIDLTEPVLFSRLLVSDTRQRPVQVVEAFYRSDRTAYQVTFRCPPRDVGGKWREARRANVRSDDASIPRLEVRSPTLGA